MANPHNPVIASEPVFPPQANLPFVDQRGMLTPYGFEWMQFVYAAIQGQGGVIDQLVLSIFSAGLIGGAAESISADASALATLRAFNRQPLQPGPLAFGGLPITPRYDAALIDLSNVQARVLTLNYTKQTFRGLLISTLGLARWFVAANDTDETGANVGSDFVVQRYDDAGVLIDAPVTIVRATGVVILSHPLHIGATQVLTTQQTTTAYAAYPGQVVSNPPTQAEVQQIDDALVAVSAALVDLRTALLTHGLIV